MSVPDRLFDPFAGALLDPAGALPLGLRTWNGSDPAARFAVYRNNVIVSLVGALADTFPVVQELVGGAFFDAMARGFVVASPPRCPVLIDYGAAFPDFVAAFQPAATVAYLPDVARLELARLRAYHAADVQPLRPAALATHVSDPTGLAGTRVALHPSLTVIESDYAIVSLWSAHQGAGRIEDVDPWRPESALVVRVGDDALVLDIPRGSAVFTAQLAACASLGRAAAAAVAEDSGFDLARALALLIGHGGIVAWQPAGGVAA